MEYVLIGFLTSLSFALLWTNRSGITTGNSVLGVLSMIGVAMSTMLLLILHAI